MKKFLVGTLAVLLLISEVGCKNQTFQADTENEIFANFTISDDSEFAYDLSFEEYFSPEEYVNLISDLISLTKVESLTPVYAINDNLLFVKQTVDTYDKYEESIAILDINGNFVTNWNSNWSAHDIQFDSKCGDYFFVITQRGLYSTHSYDVVNQNGKVIASVEGTSYRHDLGQGSVLFPYGNGPAYIINSQGNVFEMQTKSVGFSFGIDLNGIEIGKIEDGLFYVFKKGINHIIAYYYNEKGEVVIDLCDNAVPYEITKLSDFSNGKAEIEFVGVNGGAYCGIIDKSGSFVSEPQKIELN